MKWSKRMKVMSMMVSSNSTGIISQSRNGTSVYSYPSRTKITTPTTMTASLPASTAVLLLLLLRFLLTELVRPPLSPLRQTQLLQSLVDHQDVAVTGNDRVAHRLARRKAQDMMQRVSSRASVVERMQQQQRQFSLLNALEEKKAAEAAEREEWRQSYQEEMLAVASKRRRREE